MPPRATKPPTQAELLKELAAKTGLEQKQLKTVVAGLETILQQNLRKHGAITLFGLVKLTAKRVPAKPARPGRNPFTGEDMIFKAKPAHLKIKATPLKKLKDMV